LQLCILNALLQAWKLFDLERLGIDFPEVVEVVKPHL